MISANSMLPGKNGSHPTPGHGILKNGIPHHGIHPHAGMDNRMRMDAQKFLVPSLPMSNSARHDAGHIANALKRKERSLLNGNITQERDRDRENGRRYDNHQQHSPRQRESVSPMYDMIHPSLLALHQNPNNYQLPRPSGSSPGGSPNSLSPKAPSPSGKGSSTANRRGSFSPPLPGGHGDMNLSSRLYSHSAANGYPTTLPHHPNLGMQSHHAAFFAAAAAAAAAGSPYQMFGNSYGHSPHSAASSYLDSFHSNILAQQQQQLKAGSIPPSSSSSSYLPQHLRIPYHPHGTSTTSLHTKLIESSSEQQRYNGHSHHHGSGIHRNGGDYPLTMPTGNGMGNGISKNGNPLGIVSLESLAAHAAKKVQSQGQGAIAKEGTNRNSWSDRDRDHLAAYGHPSFAKTSPGGSPPNQYDLMRAEHKGLFPTGGVTRDSRGENRAAESTYRPRGTKLSNEMFEDSIPAKPPTKNKSTSNIFTFPPEIPIALRNGHMKDAAGMGLDLQAKNNLGHVQNPFQPPGSPLKRKAMNGNGQNQWNLGLNSPLSPSHQRHLEMSAAHAQAEKYLKPASKTGSVPSSPSYKSPGPVPRSPSYYKVPKSPSVTFKTTGSKVPQSPKKVLQAHNENNVNSRSLLLAPMPIEEMPVLEAFRQGSLIQLASGEIKSVENLRGEDFTHSAAQMVDSVKIIYCKILAIQEIMPARTSSSSPPFCKITLGMESHKQQVVLDSTLEQPFFVLGRGWSSLSPEMSQKLLQLNCSSLQVGDICMTLARRPLTQGSTSSSLGKQRNYSMPDSLKPNAPTVNTTSKVSEATTTVEDQGKNDAETATVAQKAGINEPGTPTSTVGCSATGSNQSTPPRPSVSPATEIGHSAPDSTPALNGLPVTSQTQDDCPSSPKRRRFSEPEEDIDVVKVDEIKQEKIDESPEVNSSDKTDVQ